MYPWLMNWAPQVHFPWSGNVAQEIAPSTTWFSDLITPQAGNARIEQKAFGVASYGKQLGLINEVLLSLVEQSSAQAGKLSPETQASIAKLKDIQAGIDAIKLREYEADAEHMVEQIAELRAHGGEAYAAMLRKLAPLLQAPAD
jgi:hypothetical protein